MNYILTCENSKLNITEDDLSNLEITEISPHEYRILHKGKNYFFQLPVNGIHKNEIYLISNKKRKRVVIQDLIQQTVNSLGFKSNHSNVNKTLNAPMPGMVMNILITEGQKIQKGDHLITLEAMKMENVLKAPHDGIIKTIHIKTSEKVEKNQLLLSFEFNS
jgi:biotin carboxyl carrier protein